MGTSLRLKSSSFIFARQMSCEMESKAFESVMNSGQTLSCFLNFFRMSSVTKKSASVVESLQRKANCVLLNILLLRELV